MGTLFEYLTQNLAWLTAGISVIVALSALFKFWGTRTEDRLDCASLTIRTSYEKIEELGERVTWLTQAIEEAPDKLDAVCIKSINTKIGKIEGDLDRLRELLFNDPDKAIEIPLILKDIEGIKTSIAAQDRKFEWISGYNKWLLGVMATMAVALLALAISVILKQ